MKKNLLPALILGLAPVPAAAQAVFPPAPPPEVRGPYVGATLGVANNRSGCIGVIAGGGRSCDSTDHSFSAFAGYQINRSFSGELSVRDLGKVSASGGGTTLSVHALAADLSAVGRIEMVDRLFALGRFGAYGAQLDSDNTGAGSASNWGFTYGLGAQWDFHPSWGARFDWQRYRNVGKDSVYGSSVYDVLSLGVVYRLR
jgi:opacity protein-like surface antigen